jgi:hypothetical protein
METPLKKSEELKIEAVELLARDWLKSRAWAWHSCSQFPQRHHCSFDNLETHLPAAIIQPQVTPRGPTTGQHDVSTDTAAVPATMYKLPHLPATYS